MNFIPDEILLGVFALVPKKGWFNLVAICKKWNRLSQQFVNPSVDDNQAICWASKNGYAKLVKVLLLDPRVNPSARKNEPICEACERGHVELVKLLLKDPRGTTIYIESVSLIDL